MSVAIVCMINNTALKEISPSFSIQDESGEANDLNKTIKSQLTETAKLQVLLLFD